MGYLLGAPPRPSSICANPVSCRFSAQLRHLDRGGFARPRFSGSGGHHRVRHRSAETRRPFPWPRVRDQRLGHRAGRSCARHTDFQVGPAKHRPSRSTCDAPTSPRITRTSHMRTSPGFRRGCRSIRAGASGRSTSTPFSRTANPSASPRSGDESSMSRMSQARATEWLRRQISSSSAPNAAARRRCTPT